ncbi:MAG: STAS/SEC14 domain-containing protein [Flavobacteriales bacterium]|nr:STAS/SEC14 domain-containing protein [Flavobacteriales bacterium]
MANKVYISESDLICVIYQGNQTYESVTSVTRQVIAAAEKLRLRHKEVKILNSLKYIKGTTAESRKAVADALMLDTYDKIALYGGNMFFKYLTKLIVIATKKSAKVKYFDSKETASKWLLMNKVNTALKE